ncbi:kinesin-like protein KIF15-B isoform X2 [Dysidea avara]|uniref:kinesin-like protein KIF15-B isoform X2 n=1 Tax=Dysidea avara TaxID=196820 RepID=UPI003334A045
MDASTGDDSIKVIVRVRPPDQRVAVDVEHGLCLQVHDARTIVMHTKPEHRVFTFDHVAGMETTQEEIFNYVGRPTIETCMYGYNGTVFAYGQTGSGKTFTMIGPPDESDSFTHELRGVIPRSFEYLFSLINREKQKHGDLVEFLCKSSFLEIYNEQVFDLMDTASSGLHLRESMKRGVYVDGLSEHIVSSAKEAYQVLTKGWNNRRVASTSMNRESSRSHAVFTVTVESKKKDSRDSVAKIRTSLLNLVDLAGSERQRDAQTEGVRLKEAGNINRSLSALGNVILALVDITHGKQRHVHYRDSRLTFLLRDSLGGNAKTFLVANVHPNAKCFGETLSTVNFARRAKMIKNKAVVNEDTTGNVMQLQAEIKKLKAALENAKAGIPPEVPESPHLGSFTSDDNKSIRELKEILSNNMAARSKAESDKMALAERMDQLEEMLNKKERFLQSTKMILRLREAHISNLEKARSADGVTDLEAETIRLMKDEINHLKYKVEHNPEVTKVTVENVDLRSEVKRLKSMLSGSPDLTRDLAKAHQYSLQLERQLNQHIGASGAEPVAGVVVPSSELSDLQMKCKTYQEELAEAKKALAEERETTKRQQVKLESNLTAAQKTNQELERTIAALKLKNSVERETLNDMHMKAIKSMMTPKRDAKSPSTLAPLGSTPHRTQSMDRGSFRSRSFTAHSRDRTSPTSPRISEERPPLIHAARVLSRSQSSLNTQDVGVNTDLSGDVMSTDDNGEYNIEGALADELQLVQASQQKLYQQVEEKENEIRRLKLEQLASDLELKTLTELLQSERSQAQEQENLLVKTMKELHSKVADLSGTKSVLESELTNVKDCLQKTESQLHSKVLELKSIVEKMNSMEEALISINSEYERSTQALQSLQDELETLREEMIFKDDCLEKNEQNLTLEREHASKLETEIQTLADKLGVEIQKNENMSLQLQEQGNKTNEKLISALNDNARLQAAYSELLANFESQAQELSSIQDENEKAKDTIASLKKSNASDQEAITNLMNNLVEYKATISSGQAKMSSLSDELLDHEKELQAATNKVEELQKALKESQSEQEKLENLHIKQIKSRDIENDLLADDLEHLTEQYQQLTSAHNQLTEELSNLKK